MKAMRLLLPIDLSKYPTEIIDLANGLTRPFDGQVILLHVLDRRKPSLREVHVRLAEQHLGRIGQFLSPAVEACIRVRAGIPHEEIVAEARAVQADLVLLPVFAAPFWKRIVGFSCGETARCVIADSPTRVFVVDVRMRLNCLRKWGLQEPSGRKAA